MTKRTDIHRPSVIQPQDYEFVGINYMKTDVEVGDHHMLKQHRDQIARHQEATGGDYSDHKHGGSCHICGAHAAYTVVFYHRPTNSYIKTGFDCAEHMDWKDEAAFRAIKEGVKNARQTKAGKQKAKATLEDLNLADAYRLYELRELTRGLNVGRSTEVEYDADRENGEHDALIRKYEGMGLCKTKMRNLWLCPAGPSDPDDRRTEKEYLTIDTYEWCFETLHDIVSKLIRYGSISEKQENFLKQLTEQCLKMNQIKEARDAKKAEWKKEKEDAPNVPEGRHEVTLTVLSAKVVETQWGMSEKMFCKSDEGWTCYGSIPRGTESFSWDAPKGYRLTIRATFKPADDPKHAFFSRPHFVKELEAVGDAKKHLEGAEV